MPPADSAAFIVARFLKANHYSESFAAFIAEAGLPDSAGEVAKGDLTLETLLEEKKTFDIAQKFEKLGVGEDGEGTGWRVPAPDQGHVVTTLPTRSNVLSTTLATLTVGDVLIVTTADRRLHILTLPAMNLHASYSSLSDSPILSCTPLTEQVLLCTTMSGTLLAISGRGDILDKRKDHSKYVVACAIHGSVVATAGWDNKVHIYHVQTQALNLGEPVATITLPTKPEGLVFLSHPETGEPVLVLSRTDSSSLHYYSIPSPSSPTSTASPTLLGTQNLAPHSNAWVAFTPSSLALCPTDHSLLAVATNSIPHMKVLLVRLLVPPSAPSDSGTVPRPASPHATQASQARAALAVADREHAAILVHANTTASQTAYSTPCVVWRTDGTGVYVNGDDGVVRGVERVTGKVVTSLGGLAGGGHEAGSKIRCLAAAQVKDGEEIMVSGGFDQRVLVWRCGETE